MKRCSLLLILLVLLFACCDLATIQFLTGEIASPVSNTFVTTGAEESPSSFTLLLTSDQHFTRREGGVHYEEDLFLQWVATYQSDHPASEEAEHLTHMISLGDITEDARSEEFTYFSEHREKLAVQGITTYAVRGNHDIRPGTNCTADWKTYVSPYSYQAFEHRGVSFYLLDTANRTLGRTQWRQLQEAVQQDKRSKLFFSHMPLYGKPSLFYLVLGDTQERENLIRLMVENKVSLYLCGHYHQGDLLHSFRRTTSEFILGAFHGRDSLFEKTKPRWYLLCSNAEEGTITITRYQVESDRSISEAVMAVLPVE